MLMADLPKAASSVSTIIPPLAIEWEDGVLSRIRTAVVEGLHRIPHGGLEIGGLLVGRRGPAGLRVVDWQPIACEHALGPSFTLSLADEAALAELIEAALGQGLEVVGWFHSHTRIDLLFTEGDQKLHERFFPENWQVALLLRPMMLRPTRAAFFYRHPDGTWNLQPEEFLLAAPEAPEVPEIPEPAVAPPPPETRLTLRQQSDLDRELYSAPVSAPARSRKLWVAVVAAILLLGLAASLPYVTKMRNGAALAPIALSLQEEAGRLRISWNPASPALENAQSGLLAIQDGPNLVEHRLTPADLKRGSMDYLRSAENVQARLTIVRDGQKSAEEWSSFLAPSAARETEADRVQPPPPAPAESEAMKAAAAKEAEEARLQQARIKAELQALEEARLKAEQERAALAQRQAEREKALEQIAENARREMARLEQLRAAAKVEPQAAPPQLTPSIPVQAPVSLPVPSADVTKIVPPPPATEPERPRYTGPSSGRLIWTGTLTKAGVLSIEDARSSLGALTGGLPRQPVRLRAYPAELSDRGITVYTSDPKHSREVHEPASRQNGWNATTYKFDPGRATDLTILEAPSARNEWRKIVLRNDSKKMSMIVLDWEVTRSARRAVP